MDHPQKTPLQQIYTGPTDEIVVEDKEKRPRSDRDLVDNKRFKVREERNIREQRRANRINEQIEMLRSLLQDADFPVETASKYHILFNCERYIKELMDKAANLAAADEAFARHGLDHQPASSSSTATSTSVHANSDDFMLEEFKPDYEKVIETADLPIAIATADGQLIRANKSFLEAMGYDAEELVKLTIFSFAVPEFRKQLFEAVGESIVSVLNSKRVPTNPKVVPIQTKTSKRVLMNISAVPQSSRNPTNVFSVPKNFLCCAILPELNYPHIG